MKRLVFALIFCLALTIKAQNPIGPIGSARGLQNFTFQNSNGFVGNVNIVSGSVVLSLQLGNQAIGFNQITNIPTASLIGRKTAGTGPIEVIATSDALDFIGNTRGAILYRGASGWSILAPGTAGQNLTTGGAGADPAWSTGSTVSSFSSGNLSPLFTASVATATTTPALSFTLSNAASKSWFGNATGSSAAPAFNTSAVPVSMLGSGSDGSGNHALFDDGTFKTLTGGGSVSTFSAGTLSPIFTTGVANATTTPALSFTISNAAAHSYLGNNTGSSAAPAYHVIDLSELSGAVTTSQITASNVTYATIQNVAASSILGNPTGSPAAPLEIGIDGGMSFSGSTLRGYSATQALSAFAIDASTAKSFSKTLSAGANTFTWSNFNDGDTLWVSCKQVASGTVGTVVFPTTGRAGAGTTKWQGGSQPTQTAGVNKIDDYILKAVGADVHAFASQNY